MIKSKFVWLASWPRSGNTYLRTILWHCFCLRSGSIYPNEFSGNERLQEYVGHIEDKKSLFVEGNIPLIKTHEAPTDSSPAIYIVRNGEAATLSLCQYYPETPLDIVIEGRHRFGTWSDHLKLWKPWDRPNTLLLRYEDLVNDLPSSLNKISIFLDISILNEIVPSRDAIANIDGRIVKKSSVSKPVLPESLSRRFHELNGELLRKMGYL